MNYLALSLVSIIGPFPWLSRLVPTQVFYTYEDFKKSKEGFLKLPIEKQRELVFASVKFIKEEEQERYWPKDQKRPKRFVELRPIVL